MDHTSLSPINMFLNAGLVGKLVMILLIFAMCWTWVLIITGVMSVRRIYQALKSVQAGESPGMLEPVLAAGREALKIRFSDDSSGQKRERVAENMSRAARELLMGAEGGLPNLAVISSVAPFVGLFGTVWGIMTSFAGIAQSQDTSLAVVAPGIAEALAATAYGLAAAIPASIGYNRIGASFSKVGQEMSHYIEEKSLRMASEDSQ